MKIVICILECKYLVQLLSKFYVLLKLTQRQYLMKNRKDVMKEIRLTKLLKEDWT